MTPSNATHELRSRLVPFITRRVDPQDVDDVVQTVFARIQRGVGELRDGDRMLPWAYQIARNAIVDHLRHASLRKHEPIDRARAIATRGDEDAASGLLELAQVVAHFIALLPEPYREALQMTELDGLTQAEAARRAGLSLPGMKSRVQRGRAQLRELLEACCAIEQDVRGAIVEVEPRKAPPSLPNCCGALHPSRAPSVSRDMTDQRQMQTKDQTTNTEPATSCCGGPAPSESGACCVKDAAAKAAGEGGCGCAAKARGPTRCC